MDSVFYPSGKPCDAASHLLARVRSTLVQLHPCRHGSAAYSAFTIFGEISLKNVR
jgi:hypothetical protein